MIGYDRYMSKKSSRPPSHPINQWVRDALAHANLSQTKLASRLHARGAITNDDRSIVNKMTIDRDVSADEMIAISDETGFPPFKYPAPTSATSLRTVKVAGFVQAGHWAETWEWGYDDQYDVAVRGTPQLAGFNLYAAETRGPSMNKRWPEGTVVVFTRVEETGEMPEVGRRYVVQRRRGNDEAEFTVKLLHRDAEGKLWLVPESDDPRHQSALSVEDGDGSEDEVAIIGRVHFAVTKE